MALSKDELEQIAQLVAGMRHANEEDREKGRHDHHLRHLAGRVAVGAFGNLGGLGFGAVGGMGAGSTGVMAALAGMEIANKGFTKAAESVTALNTTAINLTTSFGKMLAVPDSIVNLGGAVTNLLSPLKLVRVGLDSLAAIFTLNPIDKIKAPFDLIKVTFESLAEVSKALLTVFMDMRDPARLLGGALSAFTSQVTKYNPGLIERFNLAMENLSAAAGRIFEPLIDAARDFADELNVLYTAVGPAFREALTELIPPLMALGRQVVMSVTRAFIDLLPVLTPLVEIFSSVGRALARAGEYIVGQLSPAIGHFVTALQPLADAFIESLPQFIALAVSIGNLIIYIARGLLPTMQALVYATADASRGLTLFANYATRVARTGSFEGATAEWYAGVLDRELARNEIATRSFMNQPQMGALRGPVTIAAQEARQITIEQVGAEARTRAFSQSAIIQEQIRDFTRRGAEATEALVEIERSRAPGTTAPSGPIAPSM